VAKLATENELLTSWLAKYSDYCGKDDQTDVNRDGSRKARQRRQELNRGSGEVGVLMEVSVPEKEVE
jgi:hypothetical protein